MSHLALLEEIVLWKLGITPIPPAIFPPWEGGVRPDMKNKQKSFPIGSEMNLPELRAAGGGGRGVTEVQTVLIQAQDS